MTCYQKISCPHCGSNHIKKAGWSESGTQRYRRADQDCKTKTLMLEYLYKACTPGIKKKMIDMAINSSGIRDISRVLHVNKNTVIRTLMSKEDSLVQVNPLFLTLNADKPLDVRLELVCEEAKIDEQWLFVGKNQINVGYGMLWIMQQIQ